MWKTTGVAAGVLALAQEIHDSRIPLVAIGPEGLSPPDANWVPPDGSIPMHTPETQSASGPSLGSTTQRPAVRGTETGAGAGAGTDAGAGGAVWAAGSEGAGSTTCGAETGTAVGASPLCQ